MSEAGLARVAACAAELEAEAGQVIASPTTPARACSCSARGRSPSSSVGSDLELGPGDFFGELALLVEDGARVARVRATTPVRCLSIPREDFLALVETEPSFALHLLRELARRLAEARAAV